MLQPNPERRRLRDSVAVKMIAVGGLVLLLMVPLAMVRSLVAERQARQRDVEVEIAAVWGTAQTIGGPLLAVPYRMRTVDDKGTTVTWTEHAYFLPETLEISGRLTPERRHRGIFEAVVYTAELHLAGTFEQPSFAEWRIPAEDVLWDDAFLSLGVPDLRGVRGAIEVDWGGRRLAAVPGAGRVGLWTSGLKVPLPDLAAANGDERRLWAFALDLGLHGSREISFLPFGKRTVASLASVWPDPSFDGAFLPASREVGEGGFTAAWDVSWLGRGFPQRWRSSEAEQVAPPETVRASAFGVELALPVDAYQKTERSVKYGVLFLALTFLTFFIYEVFSPFALHPVQYLLVGFALCLFYLLLLSLAEHVPFGWAYAAASAAVVSLISGYSAAILEGRARAAAMAGVLAILYGYLWVLLRAEDFALLLGSLGLFVILALVMWVTRRIDWYAPRQRPAVAEK